MREWSVSVVEDDAAFREELMSALGAGTTGFDAFRDYAANRTGGVVDDVVVLDLSLPGMDGFEAILALAKEPLPPRLAVVSGASTDIIEEATKLALSLGLVVLGGFRKPVDPEHLLAAIRRPADLQESTHAWPTISDCLIGEALDRRDMSIVYQPQFDLHTERAVGAEALIRLTVPHAGAVAPPDVIAALARQGKSSAFDDWAFEVAFRDLAILRRAVPGFGISVNLSPSNPLSHALPARLVDLAKVAGIEPQAVTIELTETAQISGADPATTACLGRLRLYGFGLSMDDFGIGTSNLDRLMSLPLSEIKLDRSLVAEARRSAGARRLLSAVALMASERGARVTAEGIETRDDLALARTLGCHMVQGYLFAPPGPLEDLRARLAGGGGMSVGNAHKAKEKRP